MRDTAPSDFVRPLPGKLQRALDDNLTAGESVAVSLKADSGQAIVVTNSRVLIIKAGALFTGTGLFAARTKSFPFAEISSVDLRVGAFGGHLKISVAGTSQAPDVNIRPFDMMKVENAVTFTAANKEIMKSVAAMVQERVNVGHSGTARSAAHEPAVGQDLATEVAELARRRGGVLTEAGFARPKAGSLKGSYQPLRPPDGNARPPASHPTLAKKIAATFMVVSMLGLIAVVALAPRSRPTAVVKPVAAVKRVAPAVAYYPYLKKTPDEQSQGLWPGDTAILGSCQSPIPAFPPPGHIGPVKQKTAMPQGECAEPATGDVVAGSSDNALEWAAQTGSYKYQGQMVADRVQGGVIVLVLSGSGGPSSKVRVMESLDAAKAVSEATRMKWDLEPMEIDFRGGKDYLIQGVVQNADLHLIWRTPDRCDNSAGVWPAWCGRK